MKLSLVPFLPSVVLGLAGATLPGDGPVELGRVDWLRDHDQAFAEARRTGKPVLLLFQEIPG